MPAIKLLLGPLDGLLWEIPDGSEVEVVEIHIQRAVLIQMKGYSIPVGLCTVAFYKRVEDAEYGSFLYRWQPEQAV